MRLGLTLSVLRTARALQQLTRHGSRPALRRGAVVAAEPPARPRARAPRAPRATGKLRQLPHAPKADELLRRAASRAAKVPRDAAEPNARRRAAKQAAARADAMGQAVSVPLRQVLDAHAPEALRRSLHPFEHATATLTAAARVRAGARPLEAIVADAREEGPLSLAPHLVEAHEQLARQPRLLRQVAHLQRAIIRHECATWPSTWPQKSTNRTCLRRWCPSSRTTRS